jgi:hypothetical protein
MSDGLPTFDCGDVLPGYFPEFPGPPDGGGGGGTGCDHCGGIDDVDPTEAICCCFLGEADEPQISTVYFGGFETGWIQYYRQRIPGICAPCIAGDDLTDTEEIMSEMEQGGWDSPQLVCPPPPPNCACATNECPDCEITAQRSGTGPPPLGTWQPGTSETDGTTGNLGGDPVDFIPGAECNFEGDCAEYQACIDHECQPKFEGPPGFPDYGVGQLDLVLGCEQDCVDFILDPTTWPYSTSPWEIGTTNYGPPWYQLKTLTGNNTAGTMSDGSHYYNALTVDFQGGKITFPSVPGTFTPHANTPATIELHMEVLHDGDSILYGYGGSNPPISIPINPFTPFTAGNGGQGDRAVLGSRPPSQNNPQGKNRQGGGLGRSNSLGEGLPKNTTSKVRFPSFKGMVKAGAALFGKEKKGSSEIISTLKNKSVIDLNDPQLKVEYQTKRPTGFIDSDIALSKLRTNRMVPNTRGFNELFKDEIDINISYLLKNANKIQDWDNQYLNGITVDSVIKSLRPDVVDMFRKIINPDGTPLSNKQIFQIVGSRILDGTLSKLNLITYKKISEKHQKQKVSIIKSSDTSVNQKAALSILENSWVPLTPSGEDTAAKEMMDNWKVFSTDINKHIPITINGKLEKYYVADDNTFIDRSTLSIQDGDYFKFVSNGVESRIYCQSEKGHAYYAKDGARQKAISLLGGDNKWTMTASTDASAEVEFNYSLSAPRQNYYIMSAVLSSLETTPATQSYLLKDSKITYQLMETSTVSGISAVNDYIKYKLPWRSYTVADDDRLLDYLEHTGEVTVSQQDILFDAPKTNKKTPLLVRQVPWYIIIWPTNRQEYLLFNSKSEITSWDVSGKVTRQETFRPTLDPILSNSKSSKFISQIYDGSTTANVYGNFTPYSRKSFLASGAFLYENGYKVKGELGSAQKLAPTRTRTTFRKIKEIITELNTNYLIDDEGLGYGLNTFDVISRLGLTEYAKYRSLENFNILDPLVRNGLIEGVKVYDPIRNAGKLAIKKTRLLQRKSTATTDKYPPVKSMSTGYIVIPPTTKPNSNAFGEVPNAGQRGTRPSPRTL